MTNKSDEESNTPPRSPSANAMLADRLVSALHKAWSKQKDEPGNGHRQHAYNKEAWQELARVIDEVTKTLLLSARSETATRFVQCQYAKDVGMPEHSCSKECVYAKREEPK